MADPPAAYPARYEADVVLSDGGTVHVRPIRPHDADAIASLHERLSPETVYLRFFTALPTLSASMLHRFVNVDYADRLALVAVLGPDIIAVARYDRLPGEDAAEVAFVVDDAHQGRGIGILLLEHLATAAAERGIHRFVAETLPSNDKMLKVFHDAGFADERHYADGVVRVSFPIEPTDTSLAAMHEREQRASARSIQRLLQPSTIAVIGASRNEDTIGHAVFVNLLRGAFTGAVYPVNPNTHAVAGVRCYPSVTEVPDHIDLAVVIVPAAEVHGVVEACGRARVGGLVIVSSGFADASPEGADNERELAALARGLGMRVVGPNSMGIINTSPAVRMNATFATMPPRGGVGLMSQSGALGAVILEAMAARGLGVSSFVATGNKADVSGNDLLQYWTDDPDTDLVVLYLESFGNPRTFARVARRVSRRRPILAVKSGRGVDADAAVEALFRQAGVIRLDTLEQLFDVAQAISTQPLPGGRRVAIIGNAGGPGLVAADACRGSGLEVAQLVELPLPAGGDDYRVALDAALADEAVDAAIVFFIPPLRRRSEEVARAIAASAAASGKPVLANFPFSGGAANSVVPNYPFPESAALALGRMADHAEWLRRPQGHTPDLGLLATAQAAKLVANGLAGSAAEGWLSDEDAGELLSAYGISVGRRPVPAGRAVETVVTVEQDPDFGPLVTFGLGGAAHELLGDRCSRILPLTDVDAGEMVRSIKGAPLLFGHGGTAPVDVAALEDLLLRIGRLVDDLPDIAEVILDPVLAWPGGACAVEFGVRVSPWQPRPDLATRRLR